MIGRLRPVVNGLVEFFMVLPKRRTEPWTALEPDGKLTNNNHDANLGTPRMYHTIRPESCSDLDALVHLNGVVQQLLANLEPGFFKSQTNSAEVAAFSRHALRVHKTLSAWPNAMGKHAATFGSRNKTGQRLH